MFFECCALLASVLAGPASAHPGPARMPAEAIYRELEQSFRNERVAAIGRFVGGGYGGDRTTDLKYVTAVRNARVWEDVRQRSLTVNVAGARTAAILDAAPESLSDADLAALWRVCHDGLKCAAVDRLLALRPMTVTGRPGAGLAEHVRRAITTVTRVLTEYTTEYHSHLTYVDATDADDLTAVRRSMTVILRDNAKLCGTLSKGESLREGAAKSRRKAVSTAKPRARTSRPRAKSALGRSVRARAKRVAVPAAGHTENPIRSTGSVKLSPNVDDGRPNNENGAETNGPHPTPDAPQPAASGRETSVHDHTGAVNHTSTCGNHTTGDDHGKPADGGSCVVSDGAESLAIGRSHNVTKATGDARNDRKDDVLALANGSADAGKAGNGGNYADLDIAGVRTGKRGTAKKDYAEDGVHNNGNTEPYVRNWGVQNKDVVNRSDAAYVDTVNHGHHYRSSNKIINHETTAEMDRLEAQQFALNLEKEYATILTGFTG